MYGEKITRFQRWMQRFQLSPLEMAQAELKDAELAALHCESMAEYAALRGRIHDLETTYHRGRVERLKEFIDDHTLPVMTQFDKVIAKNSKRADGINQFDTLQG